MPACQVGDNLYRLFVVEVFGGLDDVQAVRQDVACPAEQALALEVIDGAAQGGDATVLGHRRLSILVACAAFGAASLGLAGTAAYADSSFFRALTAPSTLSGVLGLEAITGKPYETLVQEFMSAIATHRTALTEPERETWRRVQHTALRRTFLGNVVTCDGEWCELTVDDYSGYVEQDKLWGVYRGEEIE
mgnify:CR=1 FL=1